jgi:hypothetical protein
MITYPKKLRFVVTTVIRRFSALSYHEDPETLYTSVRLFASPESRKAPQFHSASPCPEKNNDSAVSHRTTCLIGRKPEISAVPHLTSRRISLKTARSRGFTPNSASTRPKNHKDQPFHAEQRVDPPEKPQRSAVSRRTARRPAQKPQGSAG